MSIKVVVFNGFPRSGKSEFQRLCAQRCGLFGQEIGFSAERKLYVDITSTVDFVKEIAYACGWDGTKTLENRKFLSDLKSLLTEWNDVPNAIIEKHVQALPNTCDWLVFVDCRESVEIQKLKERLNATTVLIRRPSIENAETSNSSDANILDYDYDLTIWNEFDGIDYLEALAESFVEYMRKEEVPYYERND